MNHPPEKSDAAREGLARKTLPPHETQRIIYKLIALDGSTTSSELANRVGLSTSQARRTLMKMVEDGALEACGANKGRVYRLKASGDRASPPAGFDGTAEDDGCELEAIALLDTDVCIELLSRTTPETFQPPASLSHARVLIPAPVITELLIFAGKHDLPDTALCRTRSFIASHGCASFDGRAAEILHGIVGNRENDAANDGPEDAADSAVDDTASSVLEIDYRDKVVAAITMANGGTLVTSDPSRYASIPGLRLEVLAHDAGI